MRSDERCVKLFGLDLWTGSQVGKGGVRPLLLFIFANAGAGVNRPSRLVILRTAALNFEHHAFTHY